MSYLSTNPLFACLVLALLCGVVYANALQNHFVFDDYDLVVENPQIRSLAKIPDILGFGDTPRRYRPVRFISYSLDHAFFGLDPRGYHAVNIVYHVLVTWLVYLIVRQLFGSPRLALLTSLLFAVHPIQTDAVTYVSGRRDVLSTLFYLLGFYAFVRYREHGKAWRLAIVFGAFVLGFFTKEMVITLPVMMLCYDWYCRFPTSQPKLDLAFWRSIVTTLGTVLRRHAALYGPILLLAGLFLVEKVILNNPSRMEGLYGSNYLYHLLSIGRIFATYIVLLCVPWQLNADYSYNAFPVTRSLTEPAALGSVLLLGLVALGLVKALQHRKHWALGGLWFFITLLPVSQLVPHHEPMAEHYLYLPSIGFCLLVALGVERLYTSARYRRAAGVAFALLVLLFSLRTVVRNADWRDDLTLWRKTVQTAPNSSRAHDNLGTAYARQKAYDKAIAQFRAALRIWPQNPLAYNHLGNAYYAAGRNDEAEAAYREAIRLKPSFAAAHFNLGRVLGRQDRVKQALQAFRRAIREHPRHVRAHHESGTAYYILGQREAARRAYLRTLELDPDYLSAYRHLAILYAEQGDWPAAIAMLQDLLQRRPEDIEAHLQLAQVYLRSATQRHQALAHLQRILVLAPQHPQATEIQQMVHTLRTQNEP